MEILEQYAIPMVMAICFVLGFVLKHAIKKLPNNLIPAILVIIGVVVNSWIEGWNMTPEILLGGIASGFLSIGLFETGKNLINKVKEAFSSSNNTTTSETTDSSTETVTEDNSDSNNSVG